MKKKKKASKFTKPENSLAAAPELQDRLQQDQQQQNKMVFTMFFFFFLHGHILLHREAVVQSELNLGGLIRCKLQEISEKAFFDLPS